MRLALTTWLLAATVCAAQDRTLDERVHAATAAFSGTIKLYATNLDSGASYGLGADDRVRTASTIKLGILATVYDEVAKGRASLSDEVVLRDADKVSGAGILPEFSDGVRIPIRDLLHLMIVLSDNTATNLVLTRFPADSVNRYLDSIGLTKTRSLRKIVSGNSPAAGVSEAGRDPELSKYGIGVSTPKEMVALVERMERGELVSAAASKEMIATLKRQQDQNGIARNMDGTVTANKTGALDHLRSDVGIVYSKGGRIAIAITCDDIPEVRWSADNPGLLKISELTGILVAGLAR